MKSKMCELYELPLDPDEWKGTCAFSGECRIGYDDRKKQKNCWIRKEFIRQMRIWKRNWRFNV
jgi:hypothetical protein